MNFQATVGTIPRMMGKGHTAELVQNMCYRMSQEMGNLPPPGNIKRMILLDRSSLPKQPFSNVFQFCGFDHAFGNTSDVRRHD